jgi:hypothetical protein
VSLLGRPWQLHDVEDVEALCGRVLDVRLRRWGAVLDEQDNEEALAFLIARAWELALKFDPWYEATRQRSFSTFLYRRLRFAVVDWYRLRHGDWRYQEERIVLSLDHDADGSLGELVESLSYGEGDPADSCIDLRGVLAGRDRSEPRDPQGADLRGHQGAALGDPAPAVLVRR